ncbi:uncharacterized protein [Miscanthus floridulus]|uniref:uncharacterized protein n=1 Tax=Miscanthus floridulus TaxID=154761 RepID=UPI003457C8D1
MAFTTTKQQRLRLRPPRGSSFVLAAPTLVLLLLIFLAVFPQPSSCRPLPADDHLHNNGVVKAAAATDVILLPLLPADAETTTMVVAAPSSGPREDDEDRHQWLLNKKPRGKAPPSAPSKRTN